MKGSSGFKSGFSGGVTQVLSVQLLEPSPILTPNWWTWRDKTGRQSLCKACSPFMNSFISEKIKRHLKNQGFSGRLSVLEV